MLNTAASELFIQTKYYITSVTSLLHGISVCKGDGIDACTTVCSKVKKKGFQFGKESFLRLYSKPTLQSNDVEMNNCIDEELIKETKRI